MAEGTRAVSGGEDLHRLRVAYQAASLLAERDTTEVVQAGFQGLIPALEDRSPARLLREGAVDEVGPQVLAAARQFATVDRSVPHPDRAGAGRGG